MAGWLAGFRQTDRQTDRQTNSKLKPPIKLSNFVLVIQWYTIMCTCLQWNAFAGMCYFIKTWGRKAGYLIC